MDPVRENEGGREENVRQRRENEGCTRGKEEWDTVRGSGGGEGREGGRDRGTLLTIPYP